MVVNSINTSMSFDHLSLPPENSNYNKPPNLVTMNTNTPNSLKHPTSPHFQFQYKHSKNKHLSQKIHKKKKNRNKQNQHKKKKIIKIKQIRHTSKKYSKHKKPKLKKSLSLSSLTQNDDDFAYMNKHNEHNEMNQKHKKIQVINNKLPYYYLHTTSTSNKNLNNYNYNKAKPNIIWVQSPSPMLVPTNIATNDPNTHQQQCTVSSVSSPFLLPVSMPLHRNACTENTDNSLAQKANLSQSPFQSPLMESVELTNSGELLMGFESGNANILFHSLSKIGDLLPQRSNCQISVVSDYKYEGLENYGNADRVQYGINNCLNTLKSINNFKGSYTAKQLSLDKLDEMERIINELRDKISEEKKCDTDTNASDNEQTDSSFLRSHLSVNTNTSDEEHEDEDGYDDDDSNQSMIAGVRFIEHPTNNGAQDKVEYYD